MGVTFGTEAEPGIDVILPDIGFLEEERHNIVGVLLTHAHEDHFGAVADLWLMLGRASVYATPFTAEMLKSKLGEMGLVDKNTTRGRSLLGAGARLAHSTLS
ncbi:MAG: MBL fold metallo-hydrolase [Hyphomicrobiales bacterium]